MSEKARAILITGCSSGIGYTCAHGMRGRGWRVFVTARKEADLEMLKAEGFETFPLDYADHASIAACASDVLAACGGRLDALFNSGAYGQPGAVEDLEPKVLRAQLETNVIGWHDLTRRIVSAMRAQGSGRIVQCSSVLGMVALKWRGAYNASKFAVEALADTLRLELEGSGVHVVVIAPGPIRSRFRETAIRHLKANVDMQSSPHREEYARQLKREEAKHAKGPTPPEKPGEGGKRGLLPQYKLGPDAVFDVLVHAVESPRPKPRYHVTAPTKLMAVARRILPIRLLHRLAARVS
ncbi:MAG: SDR family oxidoreductase [Parvibaculaceae bacterium]